jgi:phytoene desaturase
VQGMVRLFEDLGGTVQLNTAVAAIEANGATVTGVRLANGEVQPFDAVASNADVVHTYQKLLADHPRGRAQGAALAGKRHSMSLFVIYFGLKTQHPDLAHHTVLFGPRYRELISEIFKGPALSADFSLYLHAPSRSDPTLAPEGSEAFYVLAPVPHRGSADIDWAVEGPAYRDRIFAYLEERYIPNLTRDLVTSRIFTPVDFRDQLNAHLGSAFSLEPILTQSAWFRAHNRDDVIKNLYIVGAGTHPGAGVPGVIGSAKATASIMLENVPAQ